ncbi:hypothetical protein [uncultured Methylobacterium sp.]|uniref:hypothetical protein n=1 Tax=uncultured Methylobacterium sp. TaxID=157278 RepID=UPI0035CB99A0
MGVERAKLLAAKPAAQAAKDAFASEYVSGRDDLSVGLGLNQSGDDWAVMVFAQTRAAANALPDHFGDYAVEVQVTGQAKAY